jgi:hypothetical protein
MTQRPKLFVLKRSQKQRLGFQGNVLVSIADESDFCSLETKHNRRMAPRTKLFWCEDTGTKATTCKNWIELESL